MYQRIRKTTLPIAIVLFLLTCLSSYACKSQPKDQETNTPTDTQITDHPMVQDSSQADIVFLDEHRNEISLSDLKGKVVFINFWATWCPPCIREMPTIEKLKAQYTAKDPIVFLFVDVDNELDKSVAWMKKNQFNLPVFVAKTVIPNNFLASAIPATVILDKKGEIAAHIEGSRDYTSPEFKKAIDELLQENI